jgi:hypothetical protein
MKLPVKALKVVISGILLFILATIANFARPYNFDLNDSFPAYRPPSL